MILFSFMISSAAFAAPATSAKTRATNPAPTTTPANKREVVPPPPPPEGATERRLTPPRKNGKEEEYENSIQAGMILKTLKATTSGAGDNHNIALDPNTPPGFALGWSNRPLGISLEANVAYGGARPDKVATYAEDYQLRYFTGRLGAEFIYQRYRGFNQSPTSGANNDGFITTDEYSLPDLSISMLQAQFEWAYYGVSALEAFGPTWKKPAMDGLAFYVIASLSQVEIENPEPFLPQSNPQDYGEDATLVKGKYQSFSLGAGTSYVWQWTRFYVAVFGSAQAGPQKQLYETTTTRWDNLKYTWWVQAKMAIGYDWGPWYMSIIGHTQPVNVDLRTMDMSFFSQAAGLYVGSRF
ncbi:DUF4421 family protein [Bdellovibrio sp. HCB209]|uniref:DUF4421 family protein n=1 Tax=Bdellovibrio sp. HCB209 TaxID=3394354 RepID=UPI0039B5CBD4